MAGEREALEALRKRQRSARSLAFRAGIILGCATGSNDKEVAKQLRTTNWTVGFWRKRFNRGRLEALYDEPRVGAPRSISDQRVEEVITKTLESIPKNATHWSTRGLAQQLGMSQSSISRIWRAFGLQPHRSKSWLAKRPRYHLHFTPTHSSWINQVERWFAQLSQKQIKRGNHYSVKQLQEAIETFVKEHNASPKPFRWVKSADQILASITRFARSAVLKEINDSGH